MSALTTISPVDGSVFATRAHATQNELRDLLERATRAQVQWRKVPLAERSACCSRFVDAMLTNKQAIAEELTWQIGRPLAQSPGELRGFEERARAMIELAPQALAAIDPGPKPGFVRAVERVPLGVVLTVAPWNYPYLTAVNSVIPALLAGNAVILKHSAQTPLCAERFAEAFAAAGLPPSVFQFVHCSHQDVDQLIRSPEVSFVAFTGSVAGGRAVQQAAASRFIATGLELGGKDPAYVRADADLPFAVENLVDGAFFNSGQSCCGIERIYVDKRIYSQFVDDFVALTLQYRLGNPLELNVNLGPVVRTSAAEHVRGQIAEACAQGAKALVNPEHFAASKIGTPYLAPQVLVDVNHSMRVMSEESFGPVVGIMPVDGDEQAIQLMNDSAYGLTASVWTGDLERARALGDEVETGTWFMNRCDYLDPLLAWTGVKDSGRGCTLSRVGFEALTRPKSYHLRTRA
jgi:acyl-CoA reductase-like NAD-dependent aldehyde dehydrogenase